MQLEVIGPRPFSRDAGGQLATRIGTLFPERRVLYTQAPGVHAWQRLNFIDYLNAHRAASSLPPLSPNEEQALATDSVDLILESDHILIRPDPDRMELMFAADELLQTIVSKRQVKFLSVADSRVREAIKRRGEYWRLSSIPKDREAKERLVLGSKVSIRGLPIYYYNRLTGTRWLTYGEFSGLGKLEPAVLAGQLQEIAEHAHRNNRLGRPELAFFASAPQQFGPQNFDGKQFEKMPPEQVLGEFTALKARFEEAVQPVFRRDDPRDNPWSERMVSTLFLEAIIFNFIRDYGDLEYINLGSVPESLSLDRPQKEGRRGVFLAEFQARGEPHPLRRFLRLQKWGVWEHLDEGKGLLQSMHESDEYTDYWLDRRLGCRQVGMNLCRRFFMRRLTEIYRGKNDLFCGQPIRSTYFERDYVPGIATDKLPLDRYTRPGYALKMAQLLGEAAAAGIIVGRSFDSARPAFDDGDEIVREGDDGLPSEVLVADHSGAFTEYRKPLTAFAADYARPVNRRESHVPNAREFAEQYLAAFRIQFLHSQGDYSKRRRAFDTLFKHCRYDPGGSFAYRWEQVLKRLDQTDPDELLAAIRAHINVLQPR